MPGESKWNGSLQSLKKYYFLRDQLVRLRLRLLIETSSADPFLRAGPPTLMVSALPARSH